MRHKVTYTVKVHGQGAASKCLDVLRASIIELSQRAIRNRIIYMCFSWRKEKRREKRSGLLVSRASCNTRPKTLCEDVRWANY